MSAIWAAHITFGLVGLPVQLHPATQGARPRLHEVHAACGARIRHRRVCETEGREVEQHEIARGWQAPDAPSPMPTAFRRWRCGSGAAPPRAATAGPSSTKSGRRQKSRGFVHEIRFWLNFCGPPTLSDGWRLERPPGSCPKVIGNPVDVADVRGRAGDRAPAEGAAVPINRGHHGAVGRRGP
ncbi:Ku protein [Streptomyces sp. RPT161]|uniref:Ku protein n=1 Tax=Streptomyces sp. RPT161 TaxID=3015993 RepID=UPI002FCF48D7